MPGIHNGIGTTFRSAAFGGAPAANPDFVSTWDTTQAGSASDTVVLPLLSGGTYSGTIDWGDGNTSALSYANRTHVYAAGGTYTITLSGTIEGWQFNNGGDRRKILEVQNWGSYVASGVGAFFGCNNLTVSATDAPTLSGDALKVFFGDCFSLTTEDFSHWDISNCTGLDRTFYRCSSFNGDVTTWDTSNCTTFSDTNNGTFTGCTVFNQDISSWNVSSVTHFVSMFKDCKAFNQNIGAWNVGSGIYFAGMFFGATAFNQNIGAWDMSNANSISSMFRNAVNFDNAGSDDINNWDVSNVTTMRATFRGFSFQRDISNWNVGNVTSFYDTFTFCNNFNADISGWNVGSATSMYQMFYDCDAFDRSLASWDITSVTNFTKFMTLATGLSTANYDATLIGWEATLQAAYPSGAGYTPVISINFGSSQYTLGGAAEAARTSLISTFGWTITDGGGV